jgi:hypothetical protein
VSWLLMVGRKNARKLTKQEEQTRALCCECQKQGCWRQGVLSPGEGERGRGVSRKESAEALLGLLFSCRSLDSYLRCSRVSFAFAGLNGRFLGHDNQPLGTVRAFLDGAESCLLLPHPQPQHRSPREGHTRGPTASTADEPAPGTLIPRDSCLQRAQLSEVRCGRFPWQG